MDEQGTDSELIIFLEDQGEERHTIRKVWHNGRFYFSVLDIIAALQVSQQSRTYWPQLKDRVKEEGFEEAVSRIVKFRLKAADGRFRLTECADQETPDQLSPVSSTMRNSEKNRKNIWGIEGRK